MHFRVLAKALRMSGGDHIHSGTIVGKLEGEREITLGFVDLLRDDFIEIDRSRGNEWEDRKVGRRKDFLLRLMELAKHFIQTNIEPKWMVLCLLPVLPPKLRPIYHIDEDKLVTSDINEIYLLSSAPGNILKNHKNHILRAKEKLP
ncbi:hypothetical protein R6Q59_006686 [Mikania micrantha]